jgi:glycosyltransferase involved in cell wall biosynthesis
MPVLRPHPVFFPRAVRSTLRQTLHDLELVIVEDPSDRSGRDMLGGLLNDPRVRYFVNPARTSQVEQRNRTLAQSRAELVALMDADDVAEPSRLERQVAYLETHPEVGVVGSQVAVIGPSDEPLGYRAFPLSHEAIVSAMTRTVPLNQPSVMLRRSVVLAAGGYRSDLADVAVDYELWSRLAARGARFANLPEPLLRYRVHPEQLKSARLRPMIEAVLRVKAHYWRDKMDWRALAQMWGERCLLYLPPGLVYWALLRTHFRGRRPGRAGLPGAGAPGVPAARSPCPLTRERDEGLGGSSAGEALAKQEQGEAVGADRQGSLAG